MADGGFINCRNATAVTQLANDRNASDIRRLGRPGQLAGLLFHRASSPIKGANAFIGGRVHGVRDCFTAGGISCWARGSGDDYALCPDGRAVDDYAVWYRGFGGGAMG